MWPTVECEEMFPPQYKRGPPRRRKKLRRRKFDEDPNATKLKRVNTQYSCTKKPRHIARGCKSSTVNSKAQKIKV